MPYKTMIMYATFCETWSARTENRQVQGLLTKYDASRDAKAPLFLISATVPGQGHAADSRNINSRMNRRPHQTGRQCLDRDT